MLNNVENYVQKEILKVGGLPEIDEAIKLIEEYLNKTYSYESKNLRLAKWRPDEGELYEVVLATFTVILEQQVMTYQSIAGIISGRIKMRDTVERVTTAAEIIALICRTGLLSMHKQGPGLSTMISTEFELPGEFPVCEDHMPLLEPPEKITQNFTDEFGSLILGGKVNFHNGDICLDHINRMNAIPLQMNRPLLRLVEEQPKKVRDTAKKRQQWLDFKKKSYRVYTLVVRKGNRFYLPHKPDKRGRSYAVGYHVTTQGSSFKKASVQLADEEIVEMKL